MSGDKLTVGRVYAAKGEGIDIDTVHSTIQAEGLPRPQTKWQKPAMTAGASIIRELLINLGEDPNREGLKETPDRVIKAWHEWTSGYTVNPADVLKTFEDGAEQADELVLVDNIEIYSHCEHHMAPFYGVAHIGYIPDGRIVGLSKLARVADIFAKRLQVQERLTAQIAQAIEDNLKPLGVAVVIEARHHCMCSRGVNKQRSITTTSSMRGVFRTKPEARAEFLSLIKR